MSHRDYHRELVQWFKAANQKDKAIGLGILLIPGAGIVVGSYLIYKILKRDKNESKSQEATL